MAPLPVPDLADVLAARRRIAPYLRPTPLYRYPALGAMAGAQLWVKHENHQPVGAFKVRGGVNLISQLTADERQRGVIAASTGNHGQSVAYAADLFGVRAGPSRTRVTGTYDWTQLTDETRLPRARATTADKLRASLDRLAALAEGS